MKSKCNECDGDISIADDVVIGEIISCPDCGTDFEVVEVNEKNVSLKQAEAVGEDWGE
jgi:alpha-aminoadipate carrier protein LysW